MDKEYTVLELINENENISQRQLAKKTGLSLGSVNILLKKMIKEGLIKVESIPANRVVYMLTPKGMTEKISKTYKYIKLHYTYINETKEKIKNQIINLLRENGSIHIVLGEDEISDLVKSALAELQNIDNITLINKNSSFYGETPVVFLSTVEYEKYCNSYNKVFNLMELL
ncbi:winged helix-turn-helix transcriptional regulator [Alkaliphilus peptidifermentans]|uniref:Winged helix-turn-helix DNA-binding n=1 Tax=Alkaliphilus peptidifermentans DSM 18978 TaxID=1120976 RepID=A0A1G5AHZ2_9FIRM|nr:winged helix-turn-helix transcriptional regulator [Alkaliphilus peptidifermentans]SCX77488.1 Winged helix-turn-helix DNA-binding [Alkaliphilus peptidifermentans DSM 18978]